MKKILFLDDETARPTELLEDGLPLMSRSARLKLSLTVIAIAGDIRAEAV